MKSILMCILFCTLATPKLAAQLSVLDDFTEGVASASGGPNLFDSHGNPVVDFGAREAVESAIGGERSFGMGTLGFRGASSGTASMQVANGSLEVSTDFFVERIAFAYGHAGNPLNIASEELNGRLLSVAIADFNAGASRSLYITANLKTFLNNGGLDSAFFTELPLRGGGEIQFLLDGIDDDVDAIEIGITGGDSGLRFKIDQIFIVPEPATMSSLPWAAMGLLWFSRRMFTG